MTTYLNFIPRLTQHPENFRKLRAHRQIERLAGRQAAHEPLL